MTTDQDNTLIVFSVLLKHFLVDDLVALLIFIQGLQTLQTLLVKEQMSVLSTTAAILSTGDPAIIHPVTTNAAAVMLHNEKFNGTYICRCTILAEVLQVTHGQSILIVVKFAEQAEVTAKADTRWLGMYHDMAYIHHEQSVVPKW